MKQIMIDDVVIADIPDYIAEILKMSAKQEKGFMPEPPQINIPTRNNVERMLWLKNVADIVRETTFSEVIIKFKFKHLVEFYALSEKVAAYHE